MGNYILIGILVVGLLGGFSVSKAIPKFGSSKAQVTKQESNRNEYYKSKIKDKLKGIEEQVEYKSEAKNELEIPVKKTFGQKVGNFIDNFFTLVIMFVLGSIALFFFTGINVISLIRKLRKTIKQTVRGVEKAKTKLNGEKEILKTELAKEQDEETKLMIDKVKRS